MSKCIVSPQYGKDNDKNIYFYCDFCSEEMGYEEVRECEVERDKCPNCGAEIGNSEMSVSMCFSCDKSLST